MPSPSFRSVFSYIAAVAIASGIFLSLPSELGAQTAEIDGLRARIEAKSAELKRIEAEIAEYAKQIEATGKQTTSLKATIAALNATRNKLLADIRATEAKIGKATLNINKLSLEITDKATRLERTAQGLEASIRAANEAETTSFAELVLSSGGFVDVWQEIEDRRTLGGELARHIEAVRNIKADLEKNKTEKERERKTLEMLRLGLADQRKIVENNKKDQDRLLAQTKNQEALYRKSLNERIAQKNALEQEISEFENKLQIAIDPTKLPSAGRGILKWPLDNIKVTQYFGNTPFASQNAQVYRGMGHNGVDFSAPTGTPVKAALGGRVVDTGDTDIACYGVSYGKWVLIEHGNGLSTLYAHLSLFRVSAGDQVGTGDTVGYSGNTGYSTGPHLHFAVFASQGVSIPPLSGPGSYISKVCGTALKLPVSPRAGYLNPLSYL